jgi:hypothetical protein
MGATSNYSLPYQGLGDAPDGPDLGENLAVAVDTELLRIDAAALLLAARATVLEGLRITDMDTASVATDQGTATTASYVDLTTPGPAVTVDTGVKALVVVTCSMYNAVADRGGRMSYAVSGPSTVAADDSTSLQLYSATTLDPYRASAISLVTGLTPGANVFTAKYKAIGGTNQFHTRNIIVVGFA